MKAINPMQEKRSDYRIAISRSWQRPRADLYLFSVRQPIPSFLVPLRPGEQEPVLPLNRILHDLYDLGDTIWRSTTACLPTRRFRQKMRLTRAAQLLHTTTDPPITASSGRSATASVRGTSAHNNHPPITVYAGRCINIQRCPWCTCHTQLPSAL